MKFKSLLLSLLFVSSFSYSQNTKGPHAELELIIEKFRASVIDHTDLEKFSDLFLHDSVTWAAIVTGKTKEIVLSQQPAFTFQATNYKSFFEKLKEGSEEKFYNVKIDVRDQFATISFDYSFHINSKTQNWGTEYWSLILVNGEWKITSVTWTQNLERFEKCPFKSADLFERGM